MGKTKKMKASQGTRTNLLEQIEGTKTIKQKKEQKNREWIKLRTDVDEEEYVSSDLTKKILTQARHQQQELEEELSLNDSKKKIKKPTVTLGPNVSDDEDQCSDDEPLENIHYENIEINEEDERALEMFMSKNPIRTRTLGDIIMEKLTEKKTEIETQLSDAGTTQLEDLNPRVKALYESVGQVLTKYRSGKLPKAFKVVPALSNWEHILYIMCPAQWSAAAMYQATRIFASNLKEHMAQKFFNLVLLPRVRDDLAEYKKLNFHMYQALRKALFKPGGFMKGILLPLLESGTCTLREAVIVGSILSENSVPLLHSAVAILKIADMDYTGANSIFLRIFLDKKYALPYDVVDSVVLHFLRFKRDTRELPVLWHQALLTFAQRYKNDITSEQQEDLLQLLTKQSHYLITPEIRREFMHAKCRDEVMNEPTSGSEIRRDKEMDEYVPEPMNIVEH